MRNLESNEFRLPYSDAHNTVVERFPDIFSFRDGKRVMPIPSESDSIGIHNGSEQVNIVFDRTKPTQFFRGLTLLRAFPESEEIRERRQFPVIGFSLDDSRGSPTGGGTYKSETLKKLFQDLSLLGYTDALLYEENPLETNNLLEREAVKKAITVAEELYGLTVCGGMQLFTHVEAIVSDKRYRQFAKNSNSFDLQNPNTHRFFRDELVPQAVDLFGNGKAVNIGGDELVKVGDIDVEGIRQHLVGIVQLFAEHDTAVMMWADEIQNMPFGELQRLMGKAQLILAHWDYGTEDEYVLSKTLLYLKQIGVPVYTFSGLQDWNRFDTHYDKAEASIRTHAHAGKKAQVDGFFTSSWGDGRSKHPLSGNMLGLVIHAAYGYAKDRDPEHIERVLFALTGEHSEQFREAGKMDSLSQKDSHNEFPPNLSQVLLYEDVLTHPFSGSMPCMNFAEKYEEHYQQLQSFLSSTPSDMMLTRKRQIALADVLRIKSGLGNRLQQAYSLRDEEALGQILRDLTQTDLRVTTLRKAHKEEWNSEKNPAGFAVIDERYQKIQDQLVFARDQRLIPYLQGQLSFIPELHFMSENGHAKFVKELLWYNDILSASTPRKNPSGSA